MIDMNAPGEFHVYYDSEEGYFRRKFDLLANARAFIRENNAGWSFYSLSVVQRVNGKWEARNLEEHHD